MLGISTHFVRGVFSYVVENKKNILIKYKIETIILFLCLFHWVLIVFLMIKFSGLKYYYVCLAALIGNVSYQIVKKPKNDSDWKIINNQERIAILNVLFYFFVLSLMYKLF